MEEMKTVKIGGHIEDNSLDAYLPEKKDFGKINFSDITNSGKWLIIFFYPADYSFVCPTELKDISDKHDKFKKENAEIIAISTDTHYVHLAWQNSEKLLADFKYPMGADPAHRISKLFGVYDKETGLALRGTFIIDPDGRLLASEINHFSVGRNADELLRKLRAFKHVRENPARLCPAKWERGQDTLVPGKDLTGKVGK